MIGVLLAMTLSFPMSDAAQALVQTSTSRSPVMSAVQTQTTGTFEVRITPVPPEADAPADAHGRMSLSKTFHGGLQGTGQGEMLGIHDGRSGAYVAIERFTGTLDGRSGGFSLVHRGVMDAGGQDLSITIVPGSGGGELTGISGVFHLTVVDGEHRYVLDYSLPEGAK
jgi:hypothetical protein